MNFLPEEIEQYAERFTTAEPEVLADLNRYTHGNVLQPRMLSGHLQGRVISMLSKMIRPEVVVEVGTYTGYSALCWAEGLAEGGVVHTIEVDDELEPKIQRFINQSDYSEKVHLHIADAKDKLKELKGPFDVVFLDADKSNYSNYLNLAIDKVRDGGYIVADNVLWSGKVVEPINSMDTDTKALYDFAELVHQNPHLENVLLPIRDGLLIARKIA